MSLKNLVKQYNNFVIENIDIVTKIESAVRFLSYVIPGK